jgi:hypothetical protein
MCSGAITPLVTCISFGVWLHPSSLHIRYRSPHFAARVHPLVDFISLSKNTGESRPPVSGRAPLPRFRAHSAPSRRVHSYRVLPTPLRSDLGLSQALAGLLLAEFGGLVSYHQHSLGHTLQGFPLSGEPYCVTAAVAVLPFLRSLALPPKHPGSEPSADFTALLPPKSPLAAAGCLDQRGPGALLGFLPSRVFLPTAVGTASSPLLPCAYENGPHSGPLPGASESHRAMGSPGLSRDWLPSWGCRRIGRSRVGRRSEQHFQWPKACFTLLNCLTPTDRQCTRKYTLREVMAKCLHLTRIERKAHTFKCTLCFLIFQRKTDAYTQNRSFT